MIKEEMIMRMFCKQRLYYPYEKLSIGDKENIKKSLGYAGFTLGVRVQELWIEIKKELPIQECNNLCERIDKWLRKKKV